MAAVHFVHFVIDLTSPVMSAMTLMAPRLMASSMMRAQLIVLFIVKDRFFFSAMLSMLVNVLIQWDIVVFRFPLLFPFVVMMPSWLLLAVVKVLRATPVV